MFTRLLVGLDGSPRADVALEQAVVLGRRFHATIVVAHVREPGSGTEAAGSGAALLERARERVAAAGLRVETVERRGEADLELAALARDADAVLIGRRGGTTAGDALGPTAAAMVRTAEVCVILCGARVSGMHRVAVAFDGREASKRALDLAARFASVAESIVHVIHASDDPEAGLRVVGEAEALLSLRQVAFQTHVEPGRPGEAVARAIKRTRCDALFAGAHVARDAPQRPSPVVVSHAEEILRHTDIPVVIQP
ncbi:MAG TPA: universal stress protein [Gemmatimonadales bacterium]|nr:universal stress protein [Gemmatimonadales bacterium]